jgi:hypothetical protein
MIPLVRRCCVLLVGLCWVSACGEAREVQLFAKKAPPPPPPKVEEVCGDEACPRERKVCVEAQCVECAKATDCEPAKPVCHQNTCVACVADEDCPKDKVCHVANSECTELCSDDTQCKDKARKRCDVERGLCVGCLIPADCMGHHTCDVALQRCVECAPNLDCGDAGVCGDLPPCEVETK